MIAIFVILAVIVSIVLPNVLSAATNAFGYDNYSYSYYSDSNKSEDELCYEKSF